MSQRDRDWFYGVLSGMAAFAAVYALDRVLGRHIFAP